METTKFKENKVVHTEHDGGLVESVSPFWRFEPRIEHIFLHRITENHIQELHLK